MATVMTAPAHGWLRNSSFDLSFIVGIALLAIATGLIVARIPDLFLPVLAADLWLLGYHHVVSTFTRLAFDKTSFQENRNLVLYLPIAVAAAVTLGVLYAGLWLIPTIYLHWQWWHYTRQSEGISKAYAAKSKDRDVGDLRVNRIALYLVPLAGMFAISNRSPAEFLFVPVKTIPVGDVAALVVYVAAILAVAAWIWQQVKAYRAGRMALPYVLYMVSHFSIYFFAYIYIREINYGWLVINIWHNAQYILFVWLYNNRRFAGQVDSAHKFLSTISQNSRFAIYFMTCFTISTVAYFLMSTFLSDAVGDALKITAVMSGLIIYQTLNFHHYIVDSLIWKLRKKPIRNTLGID